MRLRLLHRLEAAHARFLADKADAYADQLAARKRRGVIRALFEEYMARIGNVPPLLATRK